MGHGLDRVMEAIASLPAVAEDRVVLHAADGMLDAGPYPAILRVVRLPACARRRSRPWSLRAVPLPLARTLRPCTGFHGSGFGVRI